MFNNSDYTIVTPEQTTVLRPKANGLHVLSPDAITWHIIPWSAIERPKSKAELAVELCEAYGRFAEKNAGALWENIDYRGLEPVSDLLTKWLHADE